jgi:hypothetical protein
MNTLEPSMSDFLEPYESIGAAIAFAEAELLSLGKDCAADDLKTALIQVSGLRTAALKALASPSPVRVERGDDAIELKTLPEYFADVASGVKPFELRRHDRNVLVGNVLRLREWSPTAEAYTGRDCLRRVTYVLQNAPQFGLQEGFAIYGLAALTSPEPASGPSGDDPLFDSATQRRTWFSIQPRPESRTDCFVLGWRAALIASQSQPYNIAGALMCDPECYKELDGWMQERLCRDIAENLGLIVSSVALAQPTKPEHSSVEVAEARKDALNEAWRAVDACGGTGMVGAYARALNDACAAIEKLGGCDPNPAVGQMRACLGALDRALACEEADANAETDMSGDVYAKVNVSTLRNTILAALQAKPSGQFDVSPTIQRLSRLLELLERHSVPDATGIVYPGDPGSILGVMQNNFRLDLKFAIARLNGEG